MGFSVLPQKSLISTSFRPFPSSSIGKNSVENTRVGPFQVLDRLGTSRRQKVFRAIQVEQGREVALKFVKLPPNVPEAKALSRIQRETKILTKLVHPNLVRVYGAGVEQNNIFFAMELVHGEVLSKVLTRRGKLAWDLAVEYAKQLAHMLEYIHHEEIIHLKLTPDKVIVQDDGTIKVSDLRLNRSKKRRWDTSKSNKSLDVAAYMSPEQLVGEPGTGKSDFYSLGVILYEMITGKLPYSQPTMHLLIQAKQTETPPPISDYTLDCPVWLEKIIRHLMHIDPVQRPHSARAIVLALEEIQEIDSSGTGVAEKLTGNFNPLTAGIDKSEARKLLGYKEEAPPKMSLHQQRWVQIGGLVTALLFIAVFLGFMLRPPSDESLYRKAQQLVFSGSKDDWLAAKPYIQELLDRGEDRDYHDDATYLLSRIEFNQLRFRLEEGHRSRNTDSKNEKKLFSAQEYIQEENLPRAMAIVQQVLKEVDIVGEERHVRMLAEVMETQINSTIREQEEAAVALANAAREKTEKGDAESGKADEEKDDRKSVVTEKNGTEGALKEDEKDQPEDKSKSDGDKDLKPEDD